MGVRTGQRKVEAWVPEPLWEAFRERFGARGFTPWLRERMEEATVGVVLSKFDGIPGQRTLDEVMADADGVAVPGTGGGPGGDTAPSTAGVSQAGTRHLHKRVKTGHRWVDGRDVGVWSCSDCGLPLH